MYHELRLPSRALASDDPGYVRYAVDFDVFRAQMEHLVARGHRGLSVSQWLDDRDDVRPATVITFDDGCETDLIAAAPLLADHGFSATCYLTVDFLDRRGFLSSSQARALAATGVEVGCHSMSHAFLNDLDDAQLHREVVEAKQRLEQICGTRVRSFSCPGGRYDARLLPLALSAGYDSVTTSRALPNSRKMSGRLLGRIAVMDDTTLDSFDAIVTGRGAMKRQLKESALAAAKRLLGNRAYESLRARLLG